jgi:vanillate O-demethylase monooxygenase subunit
MYPFKDGSFAPREAWYVAAFAYEVNRQLLSRWILNEPVVLYRKESGEAVAVGGRCPHRHFPLGKGCLKGDDVMCGYHGIRFGPEGQCVNIPSQSAVPGSYRIPTYPLVEHGMWLFIWMGDKSKADSRLLPDLTEIGVADEAMVAKPLFVEHVAGRYMLLNDNLMDLSHLGYLHGSSIGNPDYAAAPEVLVERPGFLSSRRNMTDNDAPPFIEHAGYRSGKVDRLSGMDFYLPGFHAGIDEIRYSATDPVNPGKLLKSSRVYHAVTPATFTTCNYFFGMASPDGEYVESMRDYLRPVIQEDKFATEEIEKILGVVGENPRELLLRSDRNAARGRRMMQAMIDAEGIAGGRPLGQTRSCRTQHLRPSPPDSLP